MSNEISQEVWNCKDKLSARQSALKAIGFIWEGANKTFEEMQDELDRYFGWLTQDQTWVKKQQSSSPMPTPDQQKALNKVLEETGYTKEQVFEFSKCKYPNGRYPGMEDVDRWIVAINQSK